MSKIRHEGNVCRVLTTDIGSIKDAKKFVAESLFPLGIKLDGLAAGKGVTISENIREANETLDDIFIPDEIDTTPPAAPRYT